MTGGLDDNVLVIRSVTVAEIMDSEGTKSLAVQSEGDPEIWDLLGMLTAAVESVKLDLATTWTVHDGDED